MTLYNINTILIYISLFAQARVAYILNSDAAYIYIFLIILGNILRRSDECPVLVETWMTLTWPLKMNSASPVTFLSFHNCHLLHTLLLVKNCIQHWPYCILLLFIPGMNSTSMHTLLQVLTFADFYLLFCIVFD